MNKALFYKIIMYILLTIGALIMIFPFIWMILCSFKDYSEVIRTKCFKTSGVLNQN